MSYDVSGINMLQWFYSNFNASNSNNKAPTTNFRINDVDINNNYIGIGTNSNIPVTQLYNINYYISDGRSLGALFELNLPVFSENAIINLDYKIWPPSNSNGLLIQFLRDTNIKFNYRVTGKFLAIGGGGGGGGHYQANAGGGGGAGGWIYGDIVNVEAGNSLGIDIGDGGAGGTSESTNNGSNGRATRILYQNTSITAQGGQGGARGKGSTGDVTNCSSGGSGAWSNTQTSVGNVTIQKPSTASVFNIIDLYGFKGSVGNRQSNDSGGGGGGGGAGGAAVAPNPNENPGNGGSGRTVTFGNVSITLGGGGGGGGRDAGSRTPGSGGIGGGGRGGDSDLTDKNGQPGTVNTGSGGGGAASRGPANGGSGGSGTVFFYIQSSGVSL